MAAVTVTVLAAMSWLCQMHRMGANRVCKDGVSGVRQFPRVLCDNMPDHGDRKQPRMHHHGCCCEDRHLRHDRVPHNSNAGRRNTSIAIRRETDEHIRFQWQQ
jgi:hypothetical protein